MGTFWTIAVMYFISLVAMIVASVMFVLESIRGKEYVIATIIGFLCSCIIILFAWIAVFVLTL